MNTPSLVRQYHHYPLFNLQKKKTNSPKKWYTQKASTHTHTHVHTSPAARSTEPYRCPGLSAEWPWEASEAESATSALWISQSLKPPQLFSVAFCSPAKSLTFSGLMENPLVGKKLKSSRLFCSWLPRLLQIIKLYTY